MKKVFITIVSILKKFGFFIWVLFLISLFPYLISPVYNFPEPQKFSGTTFYNPYQNIESLWLKGNFNISGKAWGGITAGKDSHEEIYNFYKDKGYDVIGFSDYQKITPPVKNMKIYIPLYEHGYSIFKRHHLPLGAKKVNWIDFIYFQTLHHKQFVINSIKKNCEVLAIAHPKFLDAYLPEDFLYLSGFNMIEVLNHFRISDEHWDYALSGGNPIWILSNDDTHSIEDEWETGRFWTMINTNELSPASIYSSMKSGKTYGVKGIMGKNVNFLESVNLISDTLYITMKNQFDKAFFIRDFGKTDSVTAKSNKTFYVINPDDSYVRSVIISGENTIYLNPVIRFDGTQLPIKTASINYPLTILYITVSSIIYLILIYFTFRKLFKKKKIERL